MAAITPRSIPALTWVVDGTAQLTLGANYTAGSGGFTLATTPGWTASAAHPLSVSIIQKATYATGQAEVCTTYAVVAVNGAACTIGSVIGGTDRDYAAGDFVESRVGAATVNGPLYLLDWSGSQAGQLFTSNGAATPPGWQHPSGAGGSGTVTSVALSMPAGLAVTGSPITGAGTLAVTTTLAGLVKAAGGGLVAGVAGTDYQAPFTLTTNGSSGAATWGGNVLNIPQYSGGSGTATRSLQGLMINGTTQANSAGVMDVSIGATTLYGGFALAANRLRVGSIAHLVAAGFYDTTQTPGMGLRLYLDGPAGLLLSAPAPGAPTMPANIAGGAWSLESWIICHAVGSSGLLSSWGAVRYLGGSTGQSDVTYLLKNPGTEGPPVAVDTTLAHTLTIGGSFSVAAAQNTLTLRDFLWWFEDPLS